MKFKAKFEVLGIYTVTTQAESEDKAEDLGERTMWDADFGDMMTLKNCFDDVKLLRKEGNNYTFEYQMRENKEIYFDAEDEVDAKKKTKEYYISHSTGILKNPSYHLISVEERDRQDRAGRRLIAETLKALDEWFASHDMVETGFGPYPTKEGYDISDIHVNKYTQTVMITVSVLARPVSKNDGTRNGDEAYFLYRGKEKTIELN